MSYQVIARKYRPGTFAAVAGQEHVTRTLLNSIRNNRVAHAYVFAGLRGVGKTSIARILAKALNCQKCDNGEPCLECETCKEIASGTSLSVLEIDGASHNSVDNVRDLIDSFRSAPPPGYRYKVYVIDEVHMLSTSAFNALLKSLEEPPPYTVFILATTEAQKIPDTVLSRCQRFDFRALSMEVIQERLNVIAEKEGQKLEPDACRLLARMAEGSMRDAQSLLERVMAFSSESISATEVQEALGAVTQTDLVNLAQAVFAQDPRGALELIQGFFRKGMNPGLLLRHFAAFWRDLLLVRFSQEKDMLDLGMSADEYAQLFELIEAVDPQDLQSINTLVQEGADRALRSSFPQYMLESLVIELATRQPVRDLAFLVKALAAQQKSAGAAPTPSQPSRKKKVIQQAALKQEASEQSSSQNLRPVELDVPAPPAEFKDFVLSGSPELSPMLVEHLRRLCVHEFNSQTLKASGPELSIAYLQHGKAKSTLHAQLCAHFDVESYTVELEPGSSKGEPERGSILSDETDGKIRSLREKKQSLEGDPRMQTLKKAFPGSTLEKVRVKSEA